MIRLVVAATIAPLVLAALATTSVAGKTKKAKPVRMGDSLDRRVWTTVTHSTHKFRYHRPDGCKAKPNSEGVTLECGALLLSFSVGVTMNKPGSMTKHARDTIQQRYRGRAKVRGLKRVGRKGVVFGLDMAYQARIVRGMVYDGKRILHCGAQMVDSSDNKAQRKHYRRQLWICTKFARLNRRRR